MLLFGITKLVTKINTLASQAVQSKCVFPFKLHSMT